MDTDVDQVRAWMEDAGFQLKKSKNGGDVMVFLHDNAVGQVTVYHAPELDGAMLKYEMNSVGLVLEGGQVTVEQREDERFPHTFERFWTEVEDYCRMKCEETKHHQDRVESLGRELFV